MKAALCAGIADDRRRFSIHRQINTKETAMIPCQRDLFHIPDDVAYFNCAYTSPLLRAAEAAGQRALQAKRTPWELRPSDFFKSVEALRALFAQLVDTTAENVAIIPAVSYGIALAARNLPVQKGQQIIVLQDQFPSNIYSWRRLAEQAGGRVCAVRRPAGDDWTAALLDAIGPSAAIVAVPNCHWTDGTLIDLVPVGQKCRRQGAALVVDGTQSLGAMPFAVDQIQPDFLVTTSHKWLLGPYSLGFCYVAPKWQEGIPLEENWLNRAGSQDFSRLVDYRSDYQPGARRFDMGAVSNFFLAPIAAAALGQLLDWTVAAIANTLRRTTDAIARKAESLGFHPAPAPARSPHMIGLRLPAGKAAELSTRLARQKVYVSVRGDAVRIAPHLYNSQKDLEQLLSVLESIAG
jgi:selenocysteine lyase/cysteine desulfurase